jgi:hypothetical protein
MSKHSVRALHEVPKRALETLREAEERFFVVLSVTEQLSRKMAGC